MAHEEDARHAARSGAAQVLTVVAQALIAATHVVFARLYGRAIFGGYQAALAIAEVMARAGAGGADKAMLRYVAASRAAGDPDGVRAAIGTGLRLCLLLGGVVGVVLLLTATPISRALGSPQLAPAVRVLVPITVLSGLLQIFIQASLAARVTRANFWVRGIVEPGLLLVAGVLAWTLGADLRGLATAHVLAAAATVLIAVLVVRRALRPGEREGLLAAPRLPGFTRFALPMGAAEFLNTILVRADVIILTALRGTEAAALYSAAEYLTRVVANIRYAFDSIVAGMMSEALHLGERERMRYNLALFTRWVVSVSAPLAASVIVLRRELLGGLYGDDFLAGAGALGILALSHFLNASLGLTGWVLVAAGRSRLVLLNNIAGVITNITLGFVLTARYGVVGTAGAVLGGVLVIQGCGLAGVARYERVHPFSLSLLKPLVAGVVVFAVEWAVHRSLPPGWPRVVGPIAAGTLTYAGALLALGLPPEEKRLVDRLIRRA
jgi:O-antigen/teichoic acid export membrane protein